MATILVEGGLQSVAEGQVVKAAFTPKRSQSARGGGGSSGSGDRRDTTQTTSGPSDAEKAAKRKELEREFRGNVARLEKEFRTDVRGVDRNERQRLQTELERKIGQERIAFTARKVDSGVIISGGIGRKGSGQRITKENVEQIRGMSVKEERLTPSKDIDTKGSFVEEIGPRGAFISQSKTGSRATGIIRPPTVEERIDMDKAAKAGSFETTKGIFAQQFFDKVVEPAADLTKKSVIISQAVQEKVIVPISESKAFQKVQTSFIEPFSEKVLQPTVKRIEGTRKAIADPFLKVVRKIESVREKVSRPFIAPAKTYFNLQQKYSPTSFNLIGMSSDIIQAKKAFNVKAEQSTELLKQLTQEGVSDTDLQKNLAKFKQLGGRVTEVKSDEGTTLQFEEPTVRLGLPGQVRDVPVSSLRNKGVVGWAGTIFSEEVGEAWTRLGTAAAEKKIIGVFSDKTPEEQGRALGKIAKGVTELGIWTPVTIGELGEATLGGKLGGPKSAIQFAQERPLDTAILATMGAFGTFKLVKGRKVRNISKYLDDDVRLTRQRSKVVTDVRRNPITKQRLQASLIDDTLSLESIPKKKGTAVIKEITPLADDFVGQVELVTKGGKTGKGTLEVTKKGLKETIIFEKGITRVRETAKGGKGTEKLFKKGKEIFSRKGGFITEDLASLKASVDVRKTKFNRNIPQRNVIEKVKFQNKQGTATSQYQKGKIGLYVDETGRPIIEGQKAKKLFGQVKETTETLDDLTGSGFTQTKKQTELLSDYIESGARKNVLKVKGKGGTVTLEKSQGVGIKYGKPEGVEQVRRVVKGSDDVIFSQLEPVTKRKITQATGTDIVTLYVRPGSKSSKSLRLIEKGKLQAKAKLQSQAAKLVKKTIKAETKTAKKLLKQMRIAGKKEASAGKQIQGLGARRDVKDFLKLEQSTKVVVEPASKLVSKAPAPKLAQLPGVSGFQGPVPLVKTGTGVTSGLVAIPQLNLDARLDSDVKTDVKTDLLQDTQILSASSKSLFKLDTALSQSAAVSQDIAQKQQMKQSQTTSLTQAQAQQSLSKPFSSSSQSQQQRSKSVTQIKVPIFPIPLPTSGKRVRKKKSKPSIRGNPGFHPEVKEKGKWRRIVQKARTRREALALAGKVVDNTTAVQLRLIKAKAKAIKETVKRRININKYRDYSIRKGKRRPLPNQGLIELKRNRIDTLGEKNQLSAAKYIRGRSFKKLSLVPKRRNLPKRKTTSKRGFF